jgi:DNA-binding NtrC family response regulator
MDKRDVLYVDDDRSCIELVGCIIDQLGLEADYAVCGEEALGILKNGSFAIMITDLNMPGMDGFELALMAKEFFPQMEIVIATGSFSPDIVQLAAEIGISRVIAKPYDISLIMDILVNERCRRNVSSFK